MDFQVFDAFRRCFYPDRGSLVTVPVLLFGRMTRHRNGMLFLWRRRPKVTRQPSAEDLVTGLAHPAQAN
jgi:hypothetical protein